jgi:hypothetical protein
MSAFGGKAENICSHGAFPVLTQCDIGGVEIPQRSIFLQDLSMLYLHRALFGAEAGL